jgi:malonyl-CoA O-methyltransferase
MKQGALFKQRVEQSFSDSFHYYDDEAQLQRETAKRLAASLEPWRLILPSGPMLEFGAGTGFFSEELIKLFPDRELIVSDISDEMISVCRRKFFGYNGNNIRFSRIDAESHDFGESDYSLIAGNFVAQWFNDPAITLSKMVKALKPGGLLLTAFPGADSFPEWKKHSNTLGIPFTGNSLPDTEELVIKLSMGPAKLDFYEDTSAVEFDDAYAFFRHLKRIGASVKLHEKQLGIKKLRQLIDHWNRSAGDKVTVTWHLVFLVVKKDL